MMAILSEDLELEGGYTFCCTQHGVLQVGIIQYHSTNLENLSASSAAPSTANIKLHSVGASDLRSFSMMRLGPSIRQSRTSLHIQRWCMTQIRLLSINFHFQFQCDKILLASSKNQELVKSGSINECEQSLRRWLFPRPICKWYVSRTQKKNKSCIATN